MEKVRRCKKCRSWEAQTNPLGGCCKCKEIFCYDHIMGSIEKTGVKKYCQHCAEVHLGEHF